MYQFGTWDWEDVPLVTQGSSDGAPIIEIDGLALPASGPYFVEGDVGPKAPAPLNPPTLTPDVISPTTFFAPPTSLIPSDRPVSGLFTRASDTLTPRVTETGQVSDQISPQSTNGMMTDSVGTTHQPSDSLLSPLPESTAPPNTSGPLPTSTIFSSPLASPIASSTLVPTLSSAFSPLLASTTFSVRSASSSPADLSSSSALSPPPSSSQLSSSNALGSPSSLPPLAGKDSNFNVHGGPFYIGIVFAVIAGISLLVALIAWWVRVRSHARRRDAENTFVPWAGSGKDQSGRLEAGQASDPMSDSHLVFRSRQDLAHLQAWNPRGDRDVGEPRRVNQSLFDVPNGSRASGPPDRDFPIALRPGARQLPSHLIGEYVAGDGMQEVPLHEHSHPVSFGNVGHSDQGHSSQHMVERLRLHRKRDRQALPEELGPLPTPGGPLPEVHEEVSLESWSASIKAGLATAFNAVAANLPNAPRASEEDHFTAFPKRTARKSIRDTFGREGVSGSDGLSREKSMSTTKSKPWTLEETGNGAGIVHILVNDEHSPDRALAPSSTYSLEEGKRVLPHDVRRPDNFAKARGQVSTGSTIANHLCRSPSLYSVASLQAGHPMG
ncbi:hypothetical protein CVT26_015938 [Gymnopilus dilepis]|uniref:Uncharacterized protein n=1 Tax=Gymnopilus dilepis TaxID=231916 RepID=A0A409XYM9_9AGAR|nr:hypothetical protein CVT26_015938 [Gymnopilus dilepis]